MNPILTIAKKEYRDTFHSPIAYVFISVFLFLGFWLFFANFFVQGEASLRSFFSWVPVLFIVFLPSVTMGRWAEEKKSGTIEILLTQPITEPQVVLGKFLAVFFFSATAILLTLPLAVTVGILGNLDWGPVIGSYAGLFLAAGAYLAIGLFISSLTENQIVAFILTVIALFILYFLGAEIVLMYVPEFLSPLFAMASIYAHFESLSRGVIDLRDILYYLSVAGFFILLNTMSLESRKWEA
ncbi:MAG: ABC transporter permease subunit [Deltaproteobacteria bacterium]|nr:ABC transporter permease subunit [Deltaproteobacteria bacterium]